MKKEKTIRSYKRKTKGGKVVTVKQHTAKYDAAEEMKKALAKKGAGEELASKKLTASEMKQVKDIVEERSNIGEAGDLDYLLIKMYEDIEGEGNFYLCEKRYEESSNKPEI